MTAKQIPATQGKNTDYEVGYKKPPKKSQWKKGQSGNPKGYKPPQSVVKLNALIDELFAETIEDMKGNRMSKIRAALNRLILSKAPAGQIYILDRRYGKIPQGVELTGKDGEPLQPIIIKVGVNADEL